MNQLFTNTTNGLPAPSPLAQNTTTGSTPTPFVINSQAASPFNDTWIGANNTSTIVVDLGTCTGLAAPTTACGLFNISNVFTMIQANGELYNSPDITITLNGVAANGVTPITDTIVLTAGVDYRGVASNAANTVTCTDANYVGGGSCATQTSDTAQGNATDSSPATGTNSGNTVTTFNNVFGADTGTGVNAGINYYLDVQELSLPGSGVNSFLGGYLNSIQISNVGPSGAREMFSGVTFEAASVATPEPGTVAFLGIGSALLVFLKIRKSRSTAA